jgi:hypothetical protein
LKTIFPSSAARAGGRDVDIDVAGGRDEDRAGTPVPAGAGLVGTAALRAAEGGAVADGIRKTVWHVLHRPRFPARWAANS